MKARCVNGPYVGQDFEFPSPKLNLDKDGYWHGPLVWINHGPDKYCYQVVLNQPWTWSSTARLEYRDTF